MTDHMPSMRAQRRAESNKAHAARLRAEARTNREAAPHIADADKRAAWLRAADAMERNAAEAEAEAARILREGARYAARKAAAARAKAEAARRAEMTAPAKARSPLDMTADEREAARRAEESSAPAWYLAQFKPRDAAPAKVEDAEDVQADTAGVGMSSAFRAHPQGESRFYLVRASHVSERFALPFWTPVRVWRDRAAPDGTGGGFWADAQPYGTGKTRPHIDSAIRALLADNACTSIRMIALPFRAREDAEAAAEHVRAAEAEARAAGAAYFDDGQAARVVRRYLAEDAERVAETVSAPPAQAGAVSVISPAHESVAAEITYARPVRLDWRRSAADGVHRGTFPGGRYSADVTRHGEGWAWRAFAHGMTRASRGSHSRTAEAAKRAAEAACGALGAAWFRDHDADGQAGVRAAAKAHAEDHARAVAAMPDYARIRARQEADDSMRRGLLIFAAYPSSAWRVAWAEAWRGAFLPALRNAMAARNAARAAASSACDAMREDGAERD